MGGEAADRYSAVLASVLKDSGEGRLDRSRYFYKTFNECYEDMGYGAVELDNTKVHGAESYADAMLSCY